MTEAAKQNRMEILDRWQELITRCGFTVLIDEDGVFISENTGNGRTAIFPDGISALSALHLEVIENILADLAQKTRECEELRKDLASVEESLEAQMAKFDGCPHKHETKDFNGICGCSFDKPTDVCMVHAPQLKKALAQVEQLERQVAELSKRPILKPTTPSVKFRVEEES